MVFGHKECSPACTCIRVVEKGRKAVFVASANISSSTGVPVDHDLSPFHQRFASRLASASYRTRLAERHESPTAQAGLDRADLVFSPVHALLRRASIILFV